MQVELGCIGRIRERRVVHVQKGNGCMKMLYI